MTTNLILFIFGALLFNAYNGCQARSCSNQAIKQSQSQSPSETKVYFKSSSSKYHSKKGFSFDGPVLYSGTNQSLNFYPKSGTTFCFRSIKAKIQKFHPLFLRGPPHLA